MKALSQNGFNVVGHFDSLLGTGQAARNLVDALKRAGTPVKMLNVRLTEAPVLSGEIFDDEIEFADTIWAVNPERLTQAQRYLPEATQKTRKHIGYWWWELNEIPEIFTDMSHRLDEIWAPSTFIYEVLAHSLPIPVYQIPLVVPLITPPARNMRQIFRQNLGITDSTFVTLVNVDLLSSLDRKNAMTNIEVYKSAFSTAQNTRLLIKVMNGHLRPEAHKRVVRAIDRRADITLINETFTREQMLAIIDGADALLALHRSEGLGLHLLEAMAVGTPVLTSRYSGNLDFCDDTNSVLIDGEIVIAHDTSGQYLNLPKAVWFDPDQTQAVINLQRLATDSLWANALCANGQKAYLALQNTTELGGFCKESLQRNSKVIGKQNLIGEPFVRTHLGKASLDDLNKPDTDDQGVNVIGYFEAEFGMGQYARRLLEELQVAGVMTRPFLLRSRGIRSTEPFTLNSSQAPGALEPYPINLVVVNADDFPAWAAGEGQGLIRGRYTIGVWAWELETFPDSLHAAFDYVDEVWAISRFSAAAIAEFSPVPVKAIPPVVGFHPLPAAKLDRASLGIDPDQFLISYTFDFYGGLARKNPAGLIKAFREAFPTEGEATLLLKSTNATAWPAAHKELEALSKGRSDIKLIDAYWSRAEIRSLLASSDVYASLHRSEGLGLGLAEAMAESTEVIATNYGGNLDFMTRDNSKLVNFSMAQVGQGWQPYPPEALWAEPDVAQAAQILRELFTEIHLAKSNKKNQPKVNQQIIRENLNQFFKKNLDQILENFNVPALELITIYPAEGYSKPEGDHKNPTWWQVQPTGWLAFNQINVAAHQTDLVASFVLINVPTKRACNVTVNFRGLEVQVLLKKSSQKIRVSVPIDNLLPADEIKITCHCPAWVTDGDRREFYLQVSATSISRDFSAPRHIRITDINDKIRLTVRLKRLLKF